MNRKRKPDYLATLKSQLIHLNASAHKFETSAHLTRDESQSNMSFSKGGGGVCLRIYWFCLPDKKGVSNWRSTTIFSLLLLLALGKHEKRPGRNWADHDSSLQLGWKKKKVLSKYRLWIRSLGWDRGKKIEMSFEKSTWNHRWKFNERGKF